jgi:ATP-binding cassette subfamily B multidrug efflux pump
MKLIFRYLKPFIFASTLCIILLYTQAMTELSLPNLMSDIVNVGIQQGGVESAAPEAISREGLEFASLFMTEQEKQQVEKHYLLITPDSAQAESLIQIYPILQSKPIYLLNMENIKENDLSRQNSLDTLEEIFGRSALAFVRFMQSMDEGGLPWHQPANIQEGNNDGPKISENKQDSSAVLRDMDASALYQLVPLLRRMPPEAFENAIKEAAAADSSLAKQVGTALGRMFYAELGVDLYAMQRSYILRTGAYMLLVTLLGAAAAAGVGLLASRIGSDAARMMRRDIFRKVESFSLEEFDRYSTASLITRTTNDVNQIQMVIIMGLRMMARAPIMGIGGIVMALEKSVSLSWVIALAVLVMTGVIALIFTIAVPRFKLMQKLTDKLNLVSRESLTGMMVIRAFNNQKHEEKRFEHAADDLRTNNRFVSRIMTILPSGMMLVMNLSTLVIMWAGAREIERSAMQIGDIMAFIQYAMQIIMAFLMIAFMFVMLPRALVSANRIIEVLDVQPAIQDKEQPVTLAGGCRGEIVFRNVSFRYKGAEHDALHNISFTARPGETTAIIGSTGSGKTTLVNLIARFYDVTEGEITLDGVPIQDLTQQELRSYIGYVPQKSVLFTGDIDSNIRYGKQQASSREVAQAAEIAQAGEFIRQMEEGFDSPIAQGGANVSGGQKQRLSIARALVKRAPIYIFDDSFSALDFKTDAALRKALRRHTGDSTLLIVAQRISTVMNAEQIIVLDEGKMVGIGKHSDLLKTCREYREIAESQLSGEELA